MRGPFGNTVQPRFKDSLIMKVLGLLLKQIELFVYFIIYKDIIKHDKSMATLIGPVQVKGRIQRSAVTLTALCYSHMFKTTVWLMLMWDPANRSVHYRVLALADCIFAIEATVEAMSVQETRTIFKNAMFKGIPSSLDSFATMFRINNAVDHASKDIDWRVVKDEKVG